jgi:enterochelin esterase family protein
MTLVGLVPNLVFSADHYVENPSKDGNGNYLVGPGYRIDPDLTDQNNPKGKYFEFSNAPRR